MTVPLVSSLRNLVLLTGESGPGEIRILASPIFDPIRELLADGMNCVFPGIFDILVEKFDRQNLSPGTPNDSQRPSGDRILRGSSLCFFCAPGRYGSTEKSLSIAHSLRPYLLGLCAFLCPERANLRTPL